MEGAKTAEKALELKTVDGFLVLPCGSLGLR